MAELRGLAVGYEVPISKSLQQTAGNVGLGQLQTKIKVRLTTKKKISREISVYSLHPALGNLPTLLLRYFTSFTSTASSGSILISSANSPSQHHCAAPGSSNPLL